MQAIPFFGPKYIKPGIRAIRVKKRGIWLPCRIVWSCPFNCGGESINVKNQTSDACAGLSSKGRCYGSLSGDILGVDVHWATAWLGAEISEQQSSELSDALLIYDLDETTTFKADIALERYLRLIQEGRIKDYVREEN